MAAAFLLLVLPAAATMAAPHARKDAMVRPHSAFVRPAPRHSDANAAPGPWDEPLGNADAGSLPRGSAVLSPHTGVVAGPPSVGTASRDGDALLTGPHTQSALDAAASLMTGAGSEAVAEAEEWRQQQLRAERAEYRSVMASVAAADRARQAQLAAHSSSSTRGTRRRRVGSAPPRRRVPSRGRGRGRGRGRHRGGASASRRLEAALDVIARSRAEPPMVVQGALGRFASRGLGGAAYDAVQGPATAASPPPEQQTSPYGAPSPATHMFQRSIAQPSVMYVWCRPLPHTQNVRGR